MGNIFFKILDLYFDNSTLKNSTLGVGKILKQMSIQEGGHHT